MAVRQIDGFVVVASRDISLLRNCVFHIEKCIFAKIAAESYAWAAKICLQGAGGWLTEDGRKRHNYELWFTMIHGRYAKVPHQ